MDPILANHCTHGPKNAHYTSKTIQNELVGVIDVKICINILKEVRSAKYYSIIAGEVTMQPTRKVSSGFLESC